MKPEPNARPRTARHPYNAQRPLRDTIQPPRRRRGTGHPVLPVDRKPIEARYVSLLNGTAEGKPPDYARRKPCPATANEPTDNHKGL